MLNPICTQIFRSRKARWRVSYRTLHKIGYIITSNPMAQTEIISSESSQRIGPCCSPMGTDTPTNFPFCKAGPVFGTKFPKIMPMAIANKIQSAKNRSSRPKLLKADIFAASSSSPLFIGACCSTSLSSDWVGNGSEVGFSVS